MELISPVQFTKTANKTAKMDADVIIVNNFLRHWITCDA